MIRVAKMIHFGGACPTQGEGVTDDGQEVYVRYRHGVLTVDVSDREVFRKEVGRNLIRLTDEEYRSTLSHDLSDDLRDRLIASHRKSRAFVLSQGGTFYSLDGCMSYDDVKQHTAGAIAWPDTLTEGA